MSDNIIDKIRKLKLTNFYSEWVKAKNTIGATLEVTSNCNFNCVHCYMCDLKENQKQLTFEQIIRIINILYENGILFLTFSGGDPFVRKDFKDIYIYAKKKGFIVDIFSNGTLIDEEWINIFNEYPPLLIDLSIYGASNETYEKITGRKNAFDKFIKAIKLLQKAEIRFSIKAPLLNLNYKELKKMREISNKYSKENFRFSYDIVPDRNNDLAPRRYELEPIEAVLLEISDGYNAHSLTQMGKEQNNWKKAKALSKFVPAYFCSIGNLSIHIDYLGNISPCIECAEKYNIFEDEFKKICNKFQKYKKLEAGNDYKCINCEALMFCSSCPQVRKRLYGNEQTVKDQDCIVAKLKYKYYVDNFSIQELQNYYQNYFKEVKSNEIPKT